ncbi:MAG: hypothetical protein WDZ80_02740 [Candidatus Paceibacterota bacterium]
MKIFRKTILLFLSIFLVILGVGFLQDKEEIKPISLEAQVLPEEGITLPVNWEDIGINLVDKGVIDFNKFKNIYSQRGGLKEESLNLLTKSSSNKVVMTKENSNELLNIFWALGLSNKNKILEEGPMTDIKYGGNPARFASTGGWTISVGHAMNHYSDHEFISLTKEQQEKVENVSKGIFRPCCGNSTHFPDCNHGMAMLGLLQLLSENNLTEEEMYKIALSVNSFWFPETYLTFASYFEQKEVNWDSIDPKVVLSNDFSSANGYQKILREMKPVELENNNSCSV